MEEKVTGLTLEELEAQKGELLPPREEMALYTGPATAVNVAKVTQVGVALNISGGGYGDQTAAVLQASKINQFAAANSGFIGGGGY